MGAASEFRNDRKSGVTKFCLAMEEHRRTEAGRVRTAREMVDFFFPRTNGVAVDRLFLHIPPEVRGPIVSGWGVRGAKSAVRDDDEKVRQVVQDALAAGDVDEAMFEEGVAAQTMVDWVPLSDWWSFWRTGKLTGMAIQKALATGRELGLFDDKWFLSNVDGRGGKLKGTDTLCDTLSKDQIVSWVRRLHETGDGSPAGLVGALGWETVLSKTSQEALLFALDALAKKIGLVVQEATPVDDNVAVPDIPLDLAMPPLEEGGGIRSIPLTLAEDPTPQAWAASEGAPISEPPVSFGVLDDDTSSQERSRTQQSPPPIPGRKRV